MWPSDILFEEIFQEYSDSLRRLSLLDSINITQGEKNVSGFFDIDLFDSLNNKINTIKTVYLPKLQKKNELKSVNDLIEKGKVNALRFNNQTISNEYLTLYNEI